MFFDTYVLQPPFDTTSRGQGRTTGPRLATRTGNLTPPRISPSCPHCLRLWLGRGIIVGGRGHGAACQSRCGSDGYTLASLKAVILYSELYRKVLAHPPAAVPVKGPSAKVIQLPDMKLSKNNGEAFQLPSHFLVAPKIFECKGKRSKFICSSSPNNGQKIRKSQPPLSENFFERERDGAGEGLHTPLTPHRTLTRAKEGGVSENIAFFDE